MNTSRDSGLYPPPKDANGDVKVGDFGLASSRSGVLEHSDNEDALGGSDLTSGECTRPWKCLKSNKDLGVGTGLYIAPEVLHRKKGQNHSKVDMYSLGVRPSIFPRLDVSYWL